MHELLALHLHMGGRFLIWTDLKWCADIRSELCLVSIIVLIVESHITWPASTQITATDATPARGGAVACTVSRDLAHALWMTAELRGSATTLRRDTLTTLDSVDDPGVETFFKCGDWRVISDHDFSRDTSCEPSRDWRNWNHTRDIVPAEHHALTSSQRY